MSEAENDQFTVQGISQMLWSWSTLGLKIPKEVVFALVHALMRQWDRVRVQPLTTSIWALANMGFMDEKGVFEVFRKKFATLKVEQFVPDKDMLVTGGPVHHKALCGGCYLYGAPLVGEKYGRSTGRSGRRSSQ